MNEIEILKSKLEDKRWRIFSGVIYKIKDKHGNIVPFIPNEFQEDFYNNMHTKNIVLKARQLGFSTLIDIMELDKVLFNSYISVGIIADDRNSAELIFREKIKFAYDNLPSWIKDNFKPKTDRKGELVFDNNFCSISVDTSFRGGTLQSLHISEYGKICNKYPEKAREIQTGALNTVAPTSEVFIESTAEGNSGYFYEMCMRSMELKELGRNLSDMDYKFHFYPWFIDKTYELDDVFPITTETLQYFDKVKGNEYIQKYYDKNIFTEKKMRWWQKKKEEQKDDMEREYPSFPKEAFDLAVKGSYYEKELSVAREQKRITNIQYDPRLPVKTSWDIGGAGGGDDTAIWFFQIYGKEIRFIDYWDGSGYSMVEIANTIVNTKRYEYDCHYLPHDAEVHEQTTGTTRLEVMRKHLRGDVYVVPKISVSDGIGAVRDMFPNAYFDEGNCSKGLSMLGKYRREYDEKNGMFRDKPYHKDSHGPDAIRYGAIMYNNITNNNTKYEQNFEINYDF